jgi:hypothetical protein
MGCIKIVWKILGSDLYNGTGTAASVKSIIFDNSSNIYIYIYMGWAEGDLNIKSLSSAKSIAYCDISNQTWSQAGTPYIIIQIPISKPLYMIIKTLYCLQEVNLTQFIIIINIH